MSRCTVTEGTKAAVGRYGAASLIMLSAFVSFPAAAAPFLFSTGNPDGLIATSSRIGIPGGVATETADDFVLTAQTQINQATFYGLLPTGGQLGNISDVQIAFYNVFPLDSTVPPSGNVTTRVNSPSDVDISGARRDATGGSLSYSLALLSPSFTSLNSVVNGINPAPTSFTGGEGPVTGQEVGITVTFTTPVILGAGHYFFRPQTLGEEVLWLSAPMPIVAPGTPFSPDLQSWIRSQNLAPDWLRIGTDITHQGPFNAAFSLTGETIGTNGNGTVPEPSSWIILPGLLSLLALRRRRKAGGGR